MAGREMQNSAISDLKGYVNKLGYGAKDLVPQSVDGVNNGKGMTVEDVQKLMGIYKDNDEYRKQGNAYIVDLEKRSVNCRFVRPGSRSLFRPKDCFGIPEKSNY